MLLLAAVAGCTPAEPKAEPAEWGVEAVEYFARLADAYNDNDTYGILDFYAPDAEVEKWRGDNRGSSLVPDLIRWNSADLGVDVESVYLGAETTAPVAVAVVTSYLIVAGVRYALSKRKAATGDPAPAEASSG
jgi:hypothetical protein